MGRKKKTQRELLLNHLITIRVNDAVYKKIVQLQTDSNCHSAGEVVRRILSNEKIVILHKDISMDAPMEELAEIRKELKAIGVNINQVTRHFHSSGNDHRKLFYALKTMDLYQTIDSKVERLLSTVSKMAVKWLQ